MKYLSTAFLFISLNLHASIKIASYNIRNFDYRSSSTNKIELTKILNNLKFDILGVQEIVNYSSFTKYIKKEFPGMGVALSRCGGGGRQKLGFVFNESLYRLNQTYEDQRISSPSASLSVQGCGRLRPAFIGTFTEISSGKKFVVVTVHLKAGGKSSSYSSRKAQYETLSTIVDELKINHKNIILLGDFNTTGFVDLDDDFNNFSNFLKDSGMRTSSENYQCTSYWTGMNRRDNIEESSILDHIVHGKTFLGYDNYKAELHSHCKKASCLDISSSELGTSYETVSDHCPISITFN